MRPSHHRHDAQDWWVPVMRALFLLGGGAFVLIPGLTDAGVGLTFAAMVMMSGAVLGIDGKFLRAPLFALQGVFIFSIGVLAIPIGDLESRRGLILCAAAWALVSGAFDIVVVLRHALLRGRVLLAAAGACALVGALLLFEQRHASPATANDWRTILSVTSMSSGLLLLGFGLRRRHRRRGHLSASAAAVRDERSEIPRDVPPEFFAPHKV